jgi:hypothetical protein
MMIIHVEQVTPGILSQPDALIIKERMAQAC